MKVISRISLGLAILLTFSGLSIAAPCENLMSMKFPDAKVTLAQNVAAGAFPSRLEPTRRRQPLSKTCRPFAALP